MKKINFKWIDLIPAVSGLIGKIALVTSFALMWSKELGITNPEFVFENVRTEMLVGSLITLIVALITPSVAPTGTLAPLVVMIPTMVTFGVHPFVLSLMVGIIGFLSIRTKLLEKLIAISGSMSKTSLTLVFGISGIILSVEKLIQFFAGQIVLLGVLLFLLAITYGVLLKRSKIWLMIPMAAIISLVVPLACGIKIDMGMTMTVPRLNPVHWWNDVWGIGFGVDLITIIKTLPFALFVILLWAIDTVSINAIRDANDPPEGPREVISIDHSFRVVALRNIIGGLCGGAQTGSLWRSFLIPLFMVKRPIRPAAILLGLLGIGASIMGLPIQILAFPPLIWTVLLFGIFIPFVVVGMTHFKNIQNNKQKGTIVMLSAIGLLFNPIFAWIGAVCFEKVMQRKQMKGGTEDRNCIGAE